MQAQTLVAIMACFAFVAAAPPQTVLTLSPQTFNTRTSVRSFGTSLSVNNNMMVSGDAGNGQVLCYNHASGTWTETQQILSSVYPQTSYFGKSLSHVILANGVGLLVVGAPGEFISNMHAVGAVYVYTFTAGRTWQFLQRIPAPSVAQFAYFGYSVSVSALAGATATINFAIGAPGVSSNAGAVYYYSWTNGGSITAVRSQANAVSTYTFYGFAVDLDMPSNTLAVAAHLTTSTTGRYSGVVRTFDLTAFAEHAGSPIIFPELDVTVADIDVSGTYIVISHTVAQGVSTNANTGGGPGLARGYSRSTGTWTRVMTFRVPVTSLAVNAFRTSVAIDGYNVVIGMYGASTSTTANMAMTFDCSNVVTTSTCNGVILGAPANPITSRYASMVAISGQVVIVADSTFFYLLSVIVDGGWSSWSAFGACSATCGAGTYTRSHTCTNPYPENGGAFCPGSATDTQTCYVYTWTWNIGGFGSCTPACGASYAYRSVICSRCDGYTDTDAQCVAAGQGTKPATSSPCTYYTYSWTTGGWGGCGTSCGSSTQSRSVSCLRCDNAIVDSSLCDAGSRPTAVQSCTSYTYGWAASGFGACVGTCPGSQSRSVYCARCDSQTVSNSYCSGTAPASTQNCAVYTYAWSYSGWSGCSGTCPGFQTRTVQCIQCGNTAVSGGYCTASQDVLSLSCNIYSYAWSCSAYGGCSASCGGGVMYRTCYCYRCDGIQVDGSACGSIDTSASCNTQGCGCLAGSGQLELSDGSHVAVSEIQRGASIVSSDYSGQRAVSNVCLVRKLEGKSQLVELVVENAEQTRLIRLTPLHLIYRGQASDYLQPFALMSTDLVQVQTIQVGDIVYARGNTSVVGSRVVEVQVVPEGDFYTVLSSNHRLLVDDVLVSSYSINYVWDILDSLDVLFYCKFAPWVLDLPIVQAAMNLIDDVVEPLAARFMSTPLVPSSA